MDIVASTAAAPDMSVFIVSMPCAGLMDKPPESKITPLPTSASVPRAFLPLRRRFETVLGLRTPKLEFMVAHGNDRPHLVCRPEDEARCSEEIFAYLLARDAQWSLLEFHRQDASSALVAASLVHGKRRFYTRTFPNRETATIPVQWKTLPEYVESLSRKFRSNLRRQLRTLLASGRVRYLSTMNPAATPTLLELLCLIEEQSWLTLGHWHTRRCHLKSLLRHRDVGPLLAA